MNDGPSRDEAAQGGLPPAAGESFRLDPRQPQLLDDRAHLLAVKAGYVDIFAVGADMSRRHLFRVEAGDIILDLHTAAANGAARLRIVAVGGPGAELARLPRTGAVPAELLARWIGHLAGLVIAPGLPGTMPELVPGEPRELAAGEKCRGPMRHIGWTRMTAGSAKLLGLGPSLVSADQPLPLAAGIWIEAGQEGCTALADLRPPEAADLWPAIDRIHLAIIARVEAGFARMAAEEGQRLSQRTELTQTQTIESLQSLAETVVGDTVLGAAELLPADPLLSCCRIVSAALGTSISVTGRVATGQPFRDVLEFGRSARLRVRKVQLREQWWTRDVGPLVAWRGEAR